MFKTTFIYLAFLFLAFIVGLFSSDFLFGSKGTAVIKEVVEIVEVCDESLNTVPISIEPIENLKKKNKILTIKKAQKSYVASNQSAGYMKYTYVDSLKNGIVTSTIEAKSISNRKVSLKTHNTTTTKTVRENVRYLGSSFSYQPGYGMSDLSLMVYLSKRRFLIGTGLEMDLTNLKESKIKGVLAFRF